MPKAAIGVPNLCDYRSKIERCSNVLNYALLLADKYNFDVIDIVKEKIERNALKYPVDKAKGTAKKYTEL